jgi:hypothetical protein
VNDVGKPCAGELHARFDRGPLADQAMVSRIEHRRETRRAEPGHLQPEESQRPTSPVARVAVTAAVRLSGIDVQQLSVDCE